MIRFRTPDRSLLWIVAILLAFGLIMVFSTSSVVSGDTSVFQKHLLLMAVGVAAMLTASQIDYRIYFRPWLLWFLVALTLALLVGALFSPEINNVRRWVLIGSFRAQPSELAKLVLVFLTAWLLSRVERPRIDDWGFLSYLAVVAAFLTLIVRQPDLGTATCIALTCALLLFLGGLGWSYFAGLLLVSIPALYLQVYLVPWRRERILAFLDPEGAPLTYSYQIRQSLIAVGSGGFGGLGFAQSKQKLAFLPEPQTDFIYAIVAEELGLLGCLLLLGLFAVFFWKSVRISLRADTPLGQLTGLGIVAMIVLQALINISVVLSLLPTKGIPLPLISVGGSSLLVTLASIGILLNISNGSAARRGEGG